MPTFTDDGGTIVARPPETQSAHPEAPMTRGERRRLERTMRHVDGDWIALASAALADLERVRQREGNPPVAAALVGVLAVPAGGGLGRWTITHGRHVALGTPSRTLLTDAADAVRAAAAEQAEPTDVDDA
jgi:hypothetical protein